MKSPNGQNNPPARLPGVIFCDIDGTILEHKEQFLYSVSVDTLPALPEAVQKITDWHCRGFKIIITTARPECTRELTAKQLSNAGIVYDAMVMGVGLGPRYLINDVDPKEPDTPKAIAFNVVRNSGLASVKI